MAIFVFPTLAFSQGLKLDLLDGNNCRLFCDSTKKGLSLFQDSVPFLAANNYMRSYHDIDEENGFLTSGSYFFSNDELNQSGPDRIFGLSDAARNRSQLQEQSDWQATKRSSLGKSSTGQAGKGLLNFDIPVKFPKVLSSLVGEGGPGLSVTGNYRVLFKLDKNYTTNIANSGVGNQQGTPGFQTQQEYNMYITGNVGSKLFVNMKTDKQSNVYNQRLDLADRIQIRYKGNEDDLVQSIEAGNTNLALGGTRYAGFSQSVQGLFGIKAQGKLGGINWTTIASQQKGNSQSKSFRAGTEAAIVNLRDKDYLRYVYYDLCQKRIAKPDTGGGLPAFTDEFVIGQDKIVGDPQFFKAAKGGVDQNQALPPAGKCWVNPMNTTFAPTEVASGHFYVIPYTEYELNRDSFYVRFKYPLASDDIIGAAMRVYRPAFGDTLTIGYADTTRLGPTDTLRYVLKLIKASTETNVGHYNFYYEWKNVYDLRDTDVDPDGLSVKVFKGAVGTESDYNQSNKDFQDNNSIKYLRLLGLDQYLTSGQAGFDDKIDVQWPHSVVDLARGYIIFPDRYPFNNKVSFTGNAADTLAVRAPAIYRGSTYDAGIASQYYIQIQTKTRRSQFSLGQVDISEGSEDVRLNGEKLIRGQDYQIDYQLGTIQFFNTRVNDPNADLQINYEYTPFLSSTKKNLFGLRTEYAPSEDFKLGSTVLYRNAASIDQKPRIGEEPNHALLWDGDFSYTGQSNLVTKLLDKLPVLEANAPSSYQLDGEIARSMPNPNTLGKAYIDDFEGSGDFFSLGIRRGTWTMSSAPKDDGKTQTNRGRLAWFVPDGKIKDPRNNDLTVDRFRVLEVFPDRDVPSTDERMDVLDLRYFPKKDSAGVDTTSWGGVMRWLSPGLQDQQETRLLELWVGLEDSARAPRLHFDFGQISEDINGDGKWQTEDSANIGTVLPQNDVGLDGLPDVREPGYSADTLPDPDGDDWSPDDIDHINGTEKNANDPDRLSRPDNEDLNIPPTGNIGSGQDSYFTFDVDLNDTTRFMVPGSYRVNNNRSSSGVPVPHGNEKRLIYWRQIRIPLKDSSVARMVRSPSWSKIEFARMWLEGGDTSRVLLATFDLVGNRWKELGVFDDSSRPAVGSGKVRVSVINSQENPAYRADPPPGVGEVLNRVTNLREREQSLVLSYEGLRPGRPARSGGISLFRPAPGPGDKTAGDSPARRGDQGLVQRVLLSGAEDYSGYRTMKMLVHGDRKIGAADTLSDSLLFFLRFGSGTENDPNNFYEYRVLLKPGWDASNAMNLDFNRLTNLKNVLAKSRLDAGITGGVGDTTDGTYRVRGSPSLAAVRWYVMGVQNLDTVHTAAGEVWADELLLSDVRREAGTAARFHLATQLSDFGTLNLEASRVGATFRNLAGGESGTLSYNRSAATTELLNFSGSFQGHKILPKFLGITALPISINWSRSRSTPRLRTGSDIILTPEFADAEKTEQVRRGFTIAPSLQKDTKNWLWNATFNRMSGSFSYSYFRGTDPFTRLNEQRAYAASMGYDLSPKKTLGFKPFGWLPSFWLLKKVEKTQFSPLPATFTLNGDVGRTQTITILNDVRQSRSSSYVRDFRGRLGTSFRLFPNLSADYSFNTRRDISNPDNLVFSLDPRRFKLGLEVERRQDFRSTYNPSLFRFADTRLNFSSSYNEATALVATAAGNRRIDASNGYGANMTFNLTRFLGEPKPPSAAQQARKQNEELEKKRREEEARRQEEERKLALQRRADSVRVADSLARAAALTQKQKENAPDTVAPEIRFHESLERFVPLPFPALGIVFPLLGPPLSKDSSKAAGADSNAAPAPARRDSLAAAPLNSLIPAPRDTAALGRADSAKLSAAPPDSSKKSLAPPTEGSGEIFLLSDGLNIFRGLAKRIDPVQFTYNRTNNISRQGLKDRPGLAFQFGLTNDPGQGGGNGLSDGERKTDVYTLGSGFDFGSGIRVNGRYAKNIATGRTSSARTRQEAETFPDLTLTVSGLDRRIGFLRAILPAGSLSSNYQRQQATSFDVNTGLPNTITTSKNYAPLVSVSATLFRGLSALFGYNKSIQETKTRGLGENVFTKSETRESGYNFSTRYSFIAPNGIRLPLLRGIRLSSSLNTNLAVRYTHRITRDPNPNAGTSRVSFDQSTLSVSPSMTYSFSTQLDGGFTVQWTDQKNNLDRRTTKVRSAIFSIDMKF